ncbi:MAG: hypothetical protein ACYSUK_11995 [Planctomycetota bacterium]|jgi:hypothetical protein
MKNRIFFLLNIFGILVISTVLVLAVSPSERMQLKTFGISTLDELESVKPFTTFAFRSHTGQARKLSLLNEKVINDQVEGQLKKAGIKIAGEDANNSGILAVGVVGVSPNAEQSFYIFTIQVELIQNVKLVRDEEIIAASRTWPNWTNTKLITVGPS